MQEGIWQGIKVARKSNNHCMDDYIKILSFEATEVKREFLKTRIAIALKYPK